MEGHMLLSAQELASFSGGQVQLREACRQVGNLFDGKHPDFRCGAALFQGGIQRLLIVEDSLQAWIVWYAKNEGCPTQVAPRWFKCRGKILQWSVKGVKEDSIIRKDGGLVELPLGLTDRRLILFQKGYAGREYGGLVVVEAQVVTVNKGDLF